MGVVRYNKPIYLSALSLTEFSYILNSYIEESFSDLQVRCLRVDRHSLQESGMRYFTEENEAGKKKLGARVKEIFENVWKGIVGIFTKIRDFFKDMIDKVKEFFLKIQSKIFGKKKEEPKPAEKKEEPKAAEKKEDVKKRSFTPEKINNAQDENGVQQIHQKELIQYMKNLDDKVFRDSIDKNVTKYYDTEPLITHIEYSADAMGSIYDHNIDNASRLIDLIQKFLNNPFIELNVSRINKEIVLNCAFGSFSDTCKSADSLFKSLKKGVELMSNSDNELLQQSLPLAKNLLKLATTLSTKYSSALIHNSKELMKVVHYIYNNYDRDGDFIKESANWNLVF
jgi:hypothetical protein